MVRTLNLVLRLDRSPRRWSLVTKVKLPGQGYPFNTRMNLLFDRLRYRAAMNLMLLAED